MKPCCEPVASGNDDCHHCNEFKYKKLIHIPGEGFSFDRDFIHIEDKNFDFFLEERKILSPNEIVCLVNILLNENKVLKRENAKLAKK